MSTFLENIMTGDNLPTGNYLPLDLNLINNPQYAELSIEAMVLHSLYTMRMSCSLYNSQKDGQWLDEAGHPFIYFSNEEAAQILRVSERKITTLRNSLVKAGLIKVLRHGLKNYRIYVANPTQPKPEIHVQLNFKNYITTKEKVIVPVEKAEPAAEAPLSTAAKSASTSTQNLPLSTEQPTVQLKTNQTSETQTVTEPTNDQALIAGLQARYAHLIPDQAFKRFLPFCNDYSEVKQFVDTIFKAKFVSNQQFLQAGLPPEMEGLTFEKNPYFKNGLADAIAKVLEHLYRYGTQKVKNKTAFFFSFMRGYFTECTRQYLLDYYELTPQLAHVLERLAQVQVVKKHKNACRNEKISENVF